jgi:hypothetical protein
MSHWDAWTPQEPAEDFALRTVAVALREPASRRRFDSKRWAWLAAAAAVMVAGAAWGSLARLRWELRGAPSVEEAPPGPEHDVVRPEKQRRELSEEDLRKAQENMVRLPATVTRPTRHIPALAKPDAGAYKPIVPPCYCVPGDPLCVCLPSTGNADDTTK